MRRRERENRVKSKQKKKTIEKPEIIERKWPDFVGQCKEIGGECVGAARSAPKMNGTAAYALRQPQRNPRTGRRDDLNAEGR